MEALGQEQAVGPLGPDQVSEYKREVVLPDQVFEVFNRLIAENIHGRRAKVLQKDVVERLKETGIDTSKIYSEGWLDVEPFYIEAGWNVTYDKPVYWAGENYEPYFLFKKGKAK